MIARPLVIFAGGGTGGHLFPALAVVEALRDRVPSCRVKFLATRRPIDRKVLRDTGCDLVPQPVQPLRVAKPWTFAGFGAAWVRARRRARVLFRSDQPAVVIGTGGFASGPGIVEGRRLGIPTALLNPDFVPGRANRYLASKADSVFVQWEGSAEYFRNRAAVKTTGCPVRAAFRNARRQNGLRRFGLDDRRRTLLVTGASQGARTINEAILALRDRLRQLQGWQILHITGIADEERVRDAYSDAGCNAVTVAFTDHMADALAAADLVVGRAGASSLAEVTAVGRPAILMPYPHHRDQHQTANARVLADQGAAAIVEDRINTSENAAALGEALVDLMANPARLETMATAARNIGRPKAAETVANALIDLANGALGPPDSQG